MIVVDGIEGGVLPADDRGLAYGDGAFETMRIERGGIPWLDRHLARLRTTCAALGFAPPADDLWRADTARIVDGVARGVAKLIVTRGSGGRGYATATAGRARRIALRQPWPEHPATRWSEGVCVRWCATRLAADAPLAGHKHLNRMVQVLARSEWDDPNLAEGLLQDSSGAVVEGTATNLFLVHDGTLVTPIIGGGAVAGLARAALLESAAELGLRTATRRVERTEVAEADELFICNSVVGVWPVRELDGRRVVVGTATRRAQEMLAAQGLGP